MRIASYEFIINEESLRIFECKNLWSRRPDGLYKLRIGKDSAKSYMEKYGLQLVGQAGYPFKQLQCHGVPIGMVNEVEVW